MTETRPDNKFTKPSRRGRRPIAPLYPGPIPDSSEYRALVNSILQEKRKREVIADILAERERVLAE